MEPSFGSMDKPGYRICSFVKEFVPAAQGFAPSVRTRLSTRDLLGTLGARLGLRNAYAVVPGLYATGSPDADSPVLVTANYKLSFDTLRRELRNINAWILVVETMGVNVWCAAGKHTFSSEEVASRVRETRLDKIVSHRSLVLPQLAAPGVSARKVKELCGFGVRFGPIRAKDVPAYLDAGNKAGDAMRMVTFPLSERIVLIPVELVLLAKPLLITLAALALFSILVPWAFTAEAFAPAMARGLEGLYATLAGVAAGCVLTPVALPWLPVREFALKGSIMGGAAALAWLGLRPTGLEWALNLALFAWAVVVSSYLGMNFTGSTPYTSPSGVEKEMRRWLPWQLAVGTAALGFWFLAPLF